MNLKPNVTAGVAILALVTGTLSFAGGVLEERAANHKICGAKIEENKAVRALFDDFVQQQKPPLTKAQVENVDATLLRHFPDTC